MESFLKGESLYLYKGVIYGGGGSDNNNGGGNGGGYGGGGDGGGNDPWKGFRKEPQEILLIKKRGIPLGVPNAKGSINRGNKGTP